MARYNGVVGAISLEMVPTKDGDVPGIYVTCEAKEVEDGISFVPLQVPRSHRKLYFLSENTRASGPNAGKSGIEVVSKTFKEAFNYENGLEDEELQKIVGKAVSYTTEVNGKYENITFINSPGGGRGRKKGAPLDAKLLAKLSAAWGGSPSSKKQKTSAKSTESLSLSTPTDPSAFFNQLNEQTKV